MEKEYQSDSNNSLNKKSDEELIKDLLILDSSKRDYTKAILDKRMKDSLEYLTKVIKKSNDSTEKYNVILARLTRWILWLTAIMTITTIINILIVKKII
ncbi:MAG: hypothetical protein U9O55_00950 [Patescibacteria group bacterium]|nr:hypothetical protein [Patescibacteria group bacterium]